MEGVCPALCASVYIRQCVALCVYFGFLSLFGLRKLREEEAERGQEAQFQETRGCFDAAGRRGRSQGQGSGNTEGLTLSPGRPLSPHPQIHGAHAVGATWLGEECI